MYLRDQPLSVNDFELGKTLGTGSFGRVRFVTYNKGNADKDFYAMKILKKSAIIRLKQVGDFFVKICCGHYKFYHM